MIPFSVGPDWSLISRTILPILNYDDVPVPGVSEFGLGDSVQSLFFSPKAPAAGGWIRGAGPVFLIPTATDEILGSEKWGVGYRVASPDSGPEDWGSGCSSRCFSRDEARPGTQPGSNSTELSRADAFKKRHGMTPSA